MPAKPRLRAPAGAPHLLAVPEPDDLLHQHPLVTLERVDVLLQAAILANLRAHIRVARVCARPPPGCWVRGQEQRVRWPARLYQLLHIVRLHARPLAADWFAAVDFRKQVAPPAHEQLVGELPPVGVDLAEALPAKGGERASIGLEPARSRVRPRPVLVPVLYWAAPGPACRVALT